MKSGCAAWTAGGLLALVLSILIMLMLSMGWVEERYGHTGTTVVLTSVFVLFTVLASVSLFAAILFGFSSLLIRHNSDTVEAMSSSVDSFATAVRAARAPSLPAAQSPQRNGPVFGPIVESGARPGQYALPNNSSNDAWDQPRYIPAERQIAQMEQKREQWGRPAQKGYNEVVAK